MLIELLVKIVFLAALIAYLTPMKYSAKKSLLIIAGFQCIIWIANCAFSIYVNKEFISDYLFLTIGIPGFFCFNTVAKYKGFRVLFTLLTVALFSMFSSFIGSLTIFSSPILARLLKYGSFILIILLIVKLIKKPYIKVLQTLEKGWGPLCLIPFFLINTVALLQYLPASLQEKPENIPTIIMTYILTFIIYTIFYFNFENFTQLFRLKRDRELLAVQTDMYKKQYEAMTDNMQQMRIYRHDMKHHISAIDAFLNDGNIAEAKKYMRSLNKGLDTAIVERYCDNYIINVILSSYIQKARNEKIEVECEAEIPENIQVDSIELGLVFANSLENAINACKQIENADDRKISIVCREHRGQIFIRISNPFVGEVKFDGEFPVSENPDHGIGTRSIAAIAQKYGGVTSFSAQDGVFKAMLTLKY